MFSDKRFIVYVYALKTSCLWTYKESEISQSDRSDFRVPQILDSVHLIWGLNFLDTQHPLPPALYIAVVSDGIIQI